MKLLTKTILYIATLSLFLFFLMGILFYQVLKTMSINELNREMKNMRGRVEKNLPVILEYGMTDLPGIDTTIIHEVSHYQENNPEFRDTLLLDNRSNQFRNFRVHSFVLPMRDSFYQVDLYKSTTPTDKLVERVTLMMTLMVILFLTGIFFLNRFIFSNLWKDFFIALGKLKKFNAEAGPISLSESDIQEFHELNQVLENLTERLSKDYRALKEYTDHTTHELQTPLAIIKSRVELLLQSENLSRSEVELIRDIYRNADHLSRLNSTLALITRIENQQYTETSEVNINQLLFHQLETMQELIALRNITITKKLTGREIIVHMDRGLADILIINLLKNAIIHNVEKGIIDIEIASPGLILRNSGVDIQTNSGKLFERFYRGSGNSNSLGLGLPLVKKICELYGITIEHEFRDGLHAMTLNFSQHCLISD